jgi:hypothetical protein
MNLSLRASAGAGVSVNNRTFDISTFKNRYNEQNRRYRVSLESFSFETALVAPNLPVNMFVQIGGFQPDNAWLVDDNNSYPDRTIAILNSTYSGPTFTFYTNSKTTVPISSTIPSSLTVSFRAYNANGVMMDVVINNNTYVLKLRLDPVEEDD